MSTTAPFAIETAGLVKKFGDTTAVDGLDLNVPTGLVYGVLGPNGAGKTTLIRMLATLLRPDAGVARVDGIDVAKDPSAVRRRISLTGQFSSVDEGLSGLENLILVARLQGLSWDRSRKRGAELLQAFGLAEAQDRLVKTYSGGMRRRLDIAASIVVTPNLLFLDEPTTGLDPSSRNQLWNAVRSIVRAGTTVLLTTQYLEETDQLADRIAVIARGTVIAEGTPSELKASIGSATLHVRLTHTGQLSRAEQILRDVLREEIHREGHPGELWARTSDEAAVTRGLAALTQADVALSEFSLGQPSLDEVFFSLTDDHRTHEPRRADA